MKIITQLSDKYEYNNCGFWRRSFAYIIDNIILLIVAAITILVISAIIDYYQSPITWEEFFYLIEFMLVFFPIVTLTYFESSKRYKTFGKYLLNIEVVTNDIAELSFLRAFMKTTIFYSNRILILLSFTFLINVLKLPLALQLGVFIDIVSVVLIIFTKKKQALYDIICKTQVIKRCNERNIAIRKTASNYKET